MVFRRGHPTVDRWLGLPTADGETVAIWRRGSESNTTYSSSRSRVVPLECWFWIKRGSQGGDSSIGDSRASDPGCRAASAEPKRRSHSYRHIWAGRVLSSLTGLRVRIVTSFPSDEIAGLLSFVPKGRPKIARAVQARVADHQRIRQPERATGRDNGRPEFDNPAASDALALSRPVRAFVDSRLREPGAAQAAPRALESGPYRAENVACPPRRTLRGPGCHGASRMGIDPCPRPTVISPAPTGCDPIAQVVAQRRPGVLFEPSTLESAWPRCCAACGLSARQAIARRIDGTGCSLPPSAGPVIAATPAEQKHQHDNQDDRIHDLFLL